MIILMNNFCIYSQYFITKCSLSNALIIIIISLGITIDAVNSRNRINSFLTVSSFNVCMLGVKHKAYPSYEPSLKGICEKWKTNSCCFPNVSKEYEDHGLAHGFKYSHCPPRVMSEKCKENFLEDLCFYECSPDMGPWLVKVQGMKIRKERIYRAPLCRHECEKWWEDCKDDFTCVPNWVIGFKWKKGRNNCPKSTQCRKFSDIYGSAKKFCETVFDNSWRVAEDGELCFNIGLSQPMDFYNNSLIAHAEALKIVNLIHGNSGSKPSGICFVNFWYIFTHVVVLIYWFF